MREFTHCDRQIKTRIYLGPNVLEEHVTESDLTPKVKTSTLREKKDEWKRVLNGHGAGTKLRTYYTTS